MPNILDHNADAEIPEDAEIDEQELVNILGAYFTEAQNSRRAGLNPREEIWRANIDRYWGRYDQSDKAAWQSTHVMPESAQMVDRWAAAMREALDQGGEWWTVQDDSGKLTELVPAVKKLMTVLMSRISRTHDGHPIGFSSFFEEQMKMGALTACCASVTWQADREAPNGWVRLATVDAREYWGDAKGRNLYRVRRYEMDHYEIAALARESDDNGEDVYDVEAIATLMSQEDGELREDKERITGQSEGAASPTGRKPIALKEWLCDVVTSTGEVAYQNVLVVVANDRWVIRGPEVNPFWHNRDWLVFCPMVTVPMSMYGKSYMENWADVADAFVEMTNVILDGATLASIRAFVANPSLLENATDLVDGISPAKIFTTEEDVNDVRRFIDVINLGSLSGEAVNVWKALKEELREGAMLSEISLGQFAPNSRTTGIEINAVKQSGSAMVRSMARTIEERFVEPVLMLIWKTALQHMDFNDVASAIGQENADMFNARREEFHDAAFGFQVRGISGIIDRQQRLQNLLNALQVIGNNQMLAQQLFQQMSPQKLLQTLVNMFGLEWTDIKMSAAEQQMQAIAAQLGQQEQAMMGGAPPPPGAPPA